MGVERGFIYPIQILKEASGIDAFEKVKNIPRLPGREFVTFIEVAQEFLAPIYYRSRYGRSQIIPRGWTTLEVAIVQGAMASNLESIAANIPLALGIRFGLNVLENVGVDLLGYLAHKIAVERLIRTEEL